MKAIKLAGALFLICLGVCWSPVMPLSGMRERTALTLRHIRYLADAGDYAQAVQHLDRLQVAFPKQTVEERTVIGRMHANLLVKMGKPADPPPR